MCANGEQRILREYCIHSGIIRYYHSSTVQRKKSAVLLPGPLRRFASAHTKPHTLFWRTPPWYPRAIDPICANGLRVRTIRQTNPIREKARRDWRDASRPTPPHNSKVNPEEDPRAREGTHCSHLIILLKTLWNVCHYHTVKSNAYKIPHNYSSSSTGQSTLCSVWLRLARLCSVGLGCFCAIGLPRGNRWTLLYYC